MRKKDEITFTGNSTKPGNHLWDEYTDNRTGKSTLEIHTPHNTIEYGLCNHYWELIDPNGNIQCNKCGLGQRIVWGMKFIKNGRIVDSYKKKKKKLSL